MTLNRLAALTAVCMIITGVVVYALTTPAAPHHVAPEPTSTSAPAPTLTPTTPVVPVAQSDPPTNQEWKTAASVEVTGAADLNCVAKVVRDWLRVACEGTNSSGGKPKDAKLLNAKTTKKEVGSTGILHIAWDAPGGHAYTAASSSILSLVCPFVEGVGLEARFEWTDKSAALVVSWPTGAAQPKVKGRFRIL